MQEADWARTVDVEVGEGDDALGARLRARRKALGKTMQQVADDAGLTIGFISQVERGISKPSLSSLYNLAKALEASVDMFGLEKNDFIPQVQDIITVGEFYEKAAGGHVIFT